MSAIGSRRFGEALALLDHARDVCFAAFMAYLAAPAIPCGHDVVPRGHLFHAKKPVWCPRAARKEVQLLVVGAAGNPRLHG
jgi:hypothetical protein